MESRTRTLINLLILFAQYLFFLSSLLFLKGLRIITFEYFFELEICRYFINSFFIGWLAEAAWLVFASGHARGAVFNQLVRSRAQLLGAVVCSK